MEDWEIEEYFPGENYNEYSNEIKIQRCIAKYKESVNENHKRLYYNEGQKIANLLDENNYWNNEFSKIVEERAQRVLSSKV